jgi:hypothetical protein
MRLNSSRAAAAATALVLASLVPAAWAADPAAPASAAAPTTSSTRALTTPLPPEPLTASWQPGRQWMSFRVGFARSGVTDAPDASIGGGVGYLRMLRGFKIWRVSMLQRWSLGGYVHFDQLGRFGDAVQLEVPVTAELVRHYEWGTPYLRPYIGVGAGGFYRKLYRTGNDYAHFDPGTYVVFGAHSPLDPRQVIGLDLRAAHIHQRDHSPNPVFGIDKKQATHWSIKFDYSITY